MSATIRGVGPSDLRSIGIATTAMTALLAGNRSVSAAAGLLLLLDYLACRPRVSFWLDLLDIYVLRRLGYYSRSHANRLAASVIKMSFAQRRRQPASSPSSG